MTLSRLAIAAMLATGLCSASTVVFTALPPVFQNGTYNGFATATIDGVPNQLLLCDDDAHTTYMPSDSILYDYSTLTGSNPLQFARFSDHPATMDDLTKYEVAAVLLYELNLAGSANADLVTDYQYAIWNMFDPTTSLFRPNQSALQQAAIDIVLGKATAPVWLSTAYADLAIYTPQSAYASNQEFLGLNPVPEPAMFWLLGCTLATIGVVSRKRRNRA